MKDIEWLEKYIALWELTEVDPTLSKTLSDLCDPYISFCNERGFDKLSADELLYELKEKAEGEL